MGKKKKGEARESQISFEAEFENGEYLTNLPPISVRH